MIINMFPSILTFTPKFKNLLRNYSTNITNKVSTEKETKILHIYKKGLTKREVVQYLQENIFYDEDGVVVTDKPYGVGKNKPTMFVDSYKPQSFTEVYMDEVLPELAKRLGFNSLKMGKAPERLASGVTIFTTTKEAYSKINNAIYLGVKRRYLMNKYLTVVIGHPTNKILSTKFAMTKENNIPTIVTNWSKNSIKKNFVRLFDWKHKVLASSKLACLMEISLLNKSWNSLKLYLSTKCLCPVLGDQLNFWKVSNIFGVPLLVDPLAKIDDPHKSLDTEILSALQITKNEMQIIPCHVHLQSVTIPIKKKEDLVLSVPPPESFIWTCNQLQLSIDPDLLKKNQQIVKHSKS